MSANEQLCHCGSNQKFGECCGPLLNKTKKAENPESLMRSRYSAFCLGNIDYIFETNHPSTREDLNREEISAWALQSTWKGLEIIKSDSENNTVEFRCIFNFNGQDHVHHELSTFKNEKDGWYFVDGKMMTNTYKRSGPKVGRNDPCPCGSGKKYKKCCGI